MRKKFLKAEAFRLIVKISSLIDFCKAKLYEPILEGLIPIRARRGHREVDD